MKTLLSKNDVSIVFLIELTFFYLLMDVLNEILVEIEVLNLLNILK